MLRGVNKRIIEINDVEGGYFDKILFFVKDERRLEPDSLLENKAEQYVADSCTLKYRHRFLSAETLKFALKMGISAGIGLAIGIFLL